MSADGAAHGTNARFACAALLGIVEQSGLAVLTLAENLTREELLRSRLTREEVRRQLGLLAASLGALAPDVRQAMPEFDWDGWKGLRETLEKPSCAALDDALWFAVESLTPATLLWLRVYRRSDPERFAMRP